MPKELLVSLVKYFTFLELKCLIMSDKCLICSGMQNILSYIQILHEENEQWIYGRWLKIKYTNIFSIPKPGENICQSYERETTYKIVEADWKGQEAEGRREGGGGGEKGNDEGRERNMERGGVAQRERDRGGSDERERGCD